MSYLRYSEPYSHNNRLSPNYKIFNCCWILLLTALLGGGDAISLERNIIPFITLQEEYRSRATYSEDKKSGDFVTTIIPGILFKERNHRMTTLLEAHANLQYHINNTQYNNNGPDSQYSAKISGRLTERLTTAFDGRYKIDSRTDSEIEKTGLIYDTTKRYLYHYSGGLKYLFSEKSILQITGHYTAYDFEDTNYAESWVTGFNSVFISDLTNVISSTKGRLIFGNRHYDYDQTEIVNSYTTLGVTYTKSERSEISVNTGGRYTNYKTEETDGDEIFETTTGHWGWVGDMSYLYKRQFVSHYFHFSRNIESASGRTAATIRSSIKYKMDFNLTEKTGAGFLASWFLNETEIDNARIDHASEETWNISGTFTYKYSRNINLKIGYSYSHVNDEYDNNMNRHVINFKIYSQLPLLNR